MSIGPPRISATFAALALAGGVAGCGIVEPLTAVPPAQGPPPHGRVLTGIRVLTVTSGYPGRTPSLSATTTNPGKVKKVAIMFDRLRPVRPGVVNCPMIGPAPTVTFFFRAERGGRVLAQASTLATGPRGECPSITFKAIGRERQSLFAQPAFLRSAGRVLGAALISK